MLELLAPAGEIPGIGVRIVAAIAFTSAAAYFDIFNKRWVPNWLVYSFVAVAVLLNTVFFSETVFIQSIVFGAAMFLLTYPIYKLGQLGGADVYVFAAIAATIPYLPKPLLTNTPSAPYPFIFSVLVPTGLLFILHMAFRFIPYIWQKIAKHQIKIGPAQAAGPIFILIAFTAFTYSLPRFPFPLPLSYLATVYFLMASLVFFSLFKSEIKASMVESIKVRDLQEEDVLAIEQMDQELVRRLGLKPLIDKQTIVMLSKAKVKTAPVYTGMPAFLPYLLFGLLFTVLFGDMLCYLL